MTYPPISFSNGMTKTPARMAIVRCGEQLNRWALEWQFHGRTAVTVEGYCSRKEFRTAREARAYAAGRYQTKAVLDSTNSGVE